MALLSNPSGSLDLTIDIDIGSDMGCGVYNGGSRIGHTEPSTWRAVTQKLETQNKKEGQISTPHPPDNAESEIFSEAIALFDQLKQRAGIIRHVECAYMPQTAFLCGNLPHGLIRSEMAGQKVILAVHAVHFA